MRWMHETLSQVSTYWSASTIVAALTHSNVAFRMTHILPTPPPTLTSDYRWQRFQKRAFDGPVCARSSSQGKLFRTARSQCATSSATYHLSHANHWATDRYQLAGQHSYSFLTTDPVTFQYMLPRQRIPPCTPCLLLETGIRYNTGSGTGAISSCSSGDKLEASALQSWPPR